MRGADWIGVVVCLTLRSLFRRPFSDTCRCTSCHGELKSEIEIGGTVLRKSELVKEKNDKVKKRAFLTFMADGGVRCRERRVLTTRGVCAYLPITQTAEESWVACDSCSQWVHQVCALYNARNDHGVRTTMNA